MGKIIITERQYKKLKKFLIEREINEQTRTAETLRGAAVGAAVGSAVPVVGTVAGAVIGGALAYLRGASSGSYEGVMKIFGSCNKSGVGKTTMQGSVLDGIAAEIRTAVEGNGTDEDGIKNALSKLQTIPDLCALIKRYAENYPDTTLLGELEDDLSSDEWNKYVYLPLLKAKRKSEELANQAAQAAKQKTDTAAAAKQKKSETTNKERAMFQGFIQSGLFVPGKREEKVDETKGWIYYDFLDTEEYFIMVDSKDNTIDLFYLKKDAPWSELQKVRQLKAGDPLLKRDYYKGGSSGVKPKPKPAAKPADISQYLN